MHILITNDDGIHAEGIHVLARTLRALGPVTVVAPSQEQSGAGHGLTVRQPLRATAVSIADVPDVTAWTVDGTPADCVKLAVEQLMTTPPDLVVSGINHGYNLGTDTIYSGTVAGALEGYINHIPSIAVSVQGSMRRGQHPGNFQLAADLVTELAPDFLRQETVTCLNINVPGECADAVLGRRYTRVGWRAYDHTYEKRIDPFGSAYYWLCGDLVEDNQSEDTDVMCCRAGYISITPLHFDMTDQTELERLRKTLPSAE